MFDRFFAPALTFLMLIGGTAAIASSLFTPPRTELLAAVPAQRVKPAAPLMLEPVVIVAKRSDIARQKAQPTPASQAAEGRGVQLHPARD